MSSPENLDQAVAWIREQAAQLVFGRASIEVVAHAGKITRIVTSTEVSTSAVPPTENRGAHHGADR